MLNKTIKDFFCRFYGRELTESENSAIDFTIAEHEIDTAGKWMIELFENIQGKKINEKISCLEPSYPDGDNGFSNLLADLNIDFGFDLGNFEDYGEGIEWNLDSIGLKFFLAREASPSYYILEPINLN